MLVKKGNIFVEGGSKIGRPRSRGWRKFGGRWTENRVF